MMAAGSALTTAHVAFGFVALVSFWVPLGLRKGSDPHRWAGRVFAGSMAVTGVSALGLAVASWVAPTVVHPDRDVATSRAVAAFLGYLGLVTLVIVHNLLAAVRLRADPDAVAAPWRAAVNHGATGASIGALALGGWLGSPVLLAMSPVGFLVARGWHRLVAGRAERGAWIRAHAGATLAGGIAVHTAFVAGGGTRFLPPAVTELGVIGWLLPTLVGVPAMIWWGRRLGGA